jgi:hypothetical protein
MGRVQTAYENVPKWLQEGIVTWNVFSLELENGSKVMAQSTTKKSARGFTYNFALLDEFAHVDMRIADEFFASVFPTITRGTKTKMIIVSTPKGMNHFHQMWMDAKEGKGEFNPIEVNWDVIPGRDQVFKQKTIATFGPERWKQEYECVSGETLVTIRDVNSGEIRTIPINTLRNYLV